jgi:hypothetical protein
MLPQIKQKSHRLKLVSDPNTEVKYTPFTMGQQSPIITIRETDKDQIHQIKAVIEMVQDSVTGVKIDDLYVVDFSKLFYAIRSVSESSKVSFKSICDKCEHENEIEVNVGQDFDIINNEKENYVKRITVDKDLAFEMRALKIKDIFTATDNVNIANNSFIYSFLSTCLHKVINGEETHYNVTDFEEESNVFNKEEADKFIKSLPISYGEKITDFFKNMPQMKLNKEVKCEQCKKILNVGDSGGLDSFLF